MQLFTDVEIRVKQNWKVFKVLSLVKCNKFMKMRS